MVRLKVLLKIIVTYILLFSQISCIETALVGGTLATVGASTNDKTMSEATNDFRVGKTIESEAKKRNIFISADVYFGNVLLTGNVKSQDEAQQVVDIAFTTEDVKEVFNELVVTETPKIPISTKAQDLALEKSIKNRLLITRGIRSGNFQVIVKENVAYLLGKASNQAELDKVAEVTSTTRGVAEVVSYIKIE